MLFLECSCSNLRPMNEKYDRAVSHGDLLFTVETALHKPTLPSAGDRAGCATSSVASRTAGCSARGSKPPVRPPRVRRRARAMAAMCARPPAKGREYATSRSRLAARGLEAQIRLLELELSVGATPGYPTQSRTAPPRRAALRYPQRQPVAALADFLADDADRERAGPKPRYLSHDALAEIVRPVHTGMCAPQQRQFPLRRRDAVSPVRNVPVRNSPKAPSGRLPTAPFASDNHPACNERSEPASRRSGTR